LIVCNFEEKLAMEPRRIFPCLALASIVTAIALASEVRAAFAPTDITGLQLWLDANDVNGDGIANNPSSGTAVSSWVDKSGQVHNASQATAANQPSVQNSVIGGQSVMRFVGTAAFDANQDFLVTSGYRPSLASGYTVFIVQQYPLLSNGTYLSTASATTGQNGDLIRLLDSAAPANGSPHSGGTPGVRVFSGFNGTSGFYDAAGMDGPNTAGILAVSNSSISGGGAGSIKVDLDGSNLLTTAASRSTSTTHDMNIGNADAIATGTFPYDGDIAEILIYQKVLSASEANQVGAYLQSKYSISGIYTVPEPSLAAALTLTSGIIPTLRSSRRRSRAF
jgi:hypothetical protein